VSQVLLVDDEPAVRLALEAAFQQRGWSVETAAGSGEAVRKFRNMPSRLVISDMRMPDGSGIEVMRSVRQLAPETPFIFFTAFGSIPEAVEAMKHGACDYLVKPVSFEQLELVAAAFLKNRAAPEERSPMIAESDCMRRLMERARQIASAESDVLIEAESGTGKELLARMIHERSRRRTGPLVAVNCAAFPETLLESELFGHARGAFTGAVTARPGKFEAAQGGTLLLDEIGEMPLHLQPKLLRVLQQREVERLGETRPITIDVRVIATTNRSLLDLVRENKFRNDLYYRLAVIPLSIPPLRERREDILPLAEHFLRKYGRPREEVCSLSPELSLRLRLHTWPGNVRELENVIRRGLALCRGQEIGSDALEQVQESPAQGTEMLTGVSLRAVERNLLENTLRATNGNRTRAAEMLGVSVRTIRNKVRLYGLPPRWSLQ